MSNVYSAGGWGAHSSWHRSTNWRNIPSLSRTGAGFKMKCQGRRHPTRFWVHLTDPSQESPFPRLQSQRPCEGQAEPLLPKSPHSLLSRYREEFQTRFPGWPCSFVHLPRKASVSLNIILLIQHLSPEVGNLYVLQRKKKKTKA